MINYGGDEIRERGKKSEWITARWVYRAYNSGWEICYIDEDDHITYFLEGGDEGICESEELVKYICQLHNESLKTGGDVSYPNHDFPKNATTVRWVKSLDMIKADNPGWRLAYSGCLLDKDGGCIVNNGAIKILDRQAGHSHRHWPEGLIYSKEMK